MANKRINKTIIDLGRRIKGGPKNPFSFHNPNLLPKKNVYSRPLFLLLFNISLTFTMDAAPTRTLLLIGSGPGIGVAVASLFAQKHFDHIALFARNSSQLQADKETILSSAADVGRQVHVRTWKVDISDLEQFKAALTEVQSFGTLECVYFNAARVGGSNFFDFPVEDIELDLRVGLIYCHCRGGGFQTDRLPRSLLLPSTLLFNGQRQSWSIRCKRTRESSSSRLF